MVLSLKRDSTYDQMKEILLIFENVKTLIDKKLVFKD